MICCIEKIEIEYTGNFKGNLSISSLKYVGVFTAFVVLTAE